MGVCQSMNEPPTQTKMAGRAPGREDAGPVQCPPALQSQYPTVAVSVPVKHFSLWPASADLISTFPSAFSLSSAGTNC